MAKAKLVNEHGFEILKDSKSRIPATVRFSKEMKFNFLGRLTFEKKWTQRYGWECIISLWLPEGEYPQLEITDYSIKRGRIEILIPEVVARRMRLIR